MEARKFFRALLVIVVLIYFLDLGIGSGLKWLYEHQKSGYLYGLNYCIDSTHSSFLVIGYSRANHHYDSKIFESQLNDSFYNCGRDGQNIIYSCAMASAIVHRYKPKLIIIDIRPNEFTIKDEDELTSLLPYHQNPVIRSYLPYYSRFENIKLLSRIYPYNSLLTSLVVGITEKNKKRTEDYRGFIRLDGVMQDKKFLEFREQGRLDSMKIIAFKNLLDQLDKKQIPAMIVISPLYEKYE